MGRPGPLSISDLTDAVARELRRRIRKNAIKPGHVISVNTDWGESGHNRIRVAIQDNQGKVAYVNVRIHKIIQEGKDGRGAQ